MIKYGRWHKIGLHSISSVICVANRLLRYTFCGNAKHCHNMSRPQIPQRTRLWRCHHAIEQHSWKGYMAKTAGQVGLTNQLLQNKYPAIKLYHHIRRQKHQRQKVGQFIYLGSTILTNRVFKQEVTSGIGKASTAFTKLCNIKSKILIPKKPENFQLKCNLSANIRLQDLEI